MNGLLRRLIELIRPGRLDDETTEEMSHHVDLVVAHNIARGFDKHEARRRALAEIGGIASVREQVAQERTGFPLEQWAREAKFAARALRRSPGLTVVSATTIGIGIGVSALLFTLINAIVLRPLPYPEPDRLVRIFDSNPSAGVDRTGVASGNVAEWRRRAAQGFDGIAGYYAMGRTVAFGDDADVVIAAQVSQDFFPLLGVPPHIGRVFDEDDVRRATFSSSAAPTGTDPVVLLSHSIWISRFGLLLGVLVVRGAAGTLDGLLFGVPATDALTTITVMVVVAAVGTLASLVPSWRATRIDPIQVLRRG